jgi:hypothetical protein
VGASHPPGSMRCARPRPPWRFPSPPGSKIMLKWPVGMPVLLGVRQWQRVWAVVRCVAARAAHARGHCRARLRRRRVSSRVARVLALSPSRACVHCSVRHTVRDAQWLACAAACGAAIKAAGSARTHGGRAARGVACEEVARGTWKHECLLVRSTATRTGARLLGLSTDTA